MQAIARFDLGLTDREFGRLTPAQFAALSDRLVDRAKLEDRHTALICTTVFNAQGPKRKAKIEDYLPKYGKEILTDDEIFEKVCGIHRALGGE